MQRRKSKSVNVIIILLVIVNIISITFAGVFAVLYVDKKNEVKALIGVDTEHVVPVLVNENGVVEIESENVVDNVENVTESVTENIETNAIANNEADINADDNSNGASGNEDIEQLLAERENEVEKSFKDKIKELVIGEDGNPIKAIRSLFPENLIYYDEEEYVFSPVIEELKMHNLSDENFVETDAGEMQYVENGTMTSHKGIDVSKYQGNIDWNTVASDGVEYAFVRLGLRGYVSGEIVLDEYYHQNMAGANTAGLPVGVYFFTQAITVEEAREEAQYVIDNLRDYKVDCPVVFDVEMITSGDGRANNLSKEERTQICIAFCETIKAAGYTPMIYGNVKCFTKMVDMTLLEDYEKWYAFYDDYMYFPYEVSCWQYTEKGKVAGIQGNVDLNISYKLWY